MAVLEAGAIFAAACATIGLQAWADRAGLVVLVPAALLAAVCVTAFYYNDLYDLRAVPSFVPFAARLPRSLAVALGLLVVLHLLLPGGTLIRPGLAGMLAAGLSLLVLVRALSYRLMRHRVFATRVLILGTSPLARMLIEEIRTRPHCGYTIVGVVDDRARPDEHPTWYPVLGSLQQLAGIVERVRPDRIVVALADRRGRLPIRQLVESRVVANIVVEDAAEVYERLTGKLAIEALNPGSVVFCRDFFKPRVEHAAARATSLVAAVIGLVTLLPLFLVIALAVKLDSRGPVFFVHERVGRRGRPFKLIKFRTMHPPTGTTSEWERDNHARITRVGAWLRRFRLDELPQFVNVLRGDVNIVGPRPHPVSNFALFMEHIPHYWIRFAVRPGITGWAQISYGYANNLEEETEKARYDLYYVKHMSLAFDLRIVFDTVKTVFVGRGVARARRRGAMVGARDGAPLAGEGSAESVAATPVTPADVRPAGLEHAA
jgi:exopolysaccharide biosynthesis polyprenyl glycosylphosphotransferase